MFGDKFLNLISGFYKENFEGTFKAWNVLAENGVWYDMLFFLIFIGLLMFLFSKSKLIEKLSKHILLCSFVVWFFGVFVYTVGFYGKEVNGLSVVLRSIICSFKMFVVSHELSRVEEPLSNNSSYLVVFSVLHFAAAFITFLFVFKMIGYKMKSSFDLILHRLFKSRKKVVHLFWGINDASILLAEDIRADEKRKQRAAETIIFVDIDEEKEDNTQRKATLSHITNTITIKNSDIARLDEIKVLVDHCYNGPAAFNGSTDVDIFDGLHLRNIRAIVKRSSKANFYFLSDDETQNIAGALNFQKDITLRAMVKDNGEDKDKLVFYIHARRDAHNEIFGHYSQYNAETARMKMKLIDSAYLSIAALKQDDRTLPVNSVKPDPSTGLVDSPFTALIVGFGDTGQEAFKFLYEYSAFVGSDMKKSPFKCYAIDSRMNSIEGLLREKMPAIGEDELSLTQATVDSNEFWAMVKTIIGDLNYVVIALNDDALGLSLAVNLFKYALRCRPKELPMLKIMVRCYDSDNETRMNKVEENLNKSIEGNNVEIRLFGKEKDLYRYSTVLENDTLREAKEFNRVYEGSDLSADEQWEKNFGAEKLQKMIDDKKMSRYHAIYDINRRIAQNISNSLHCRTKMILMGFAEDELSERLKLFYGYANSRGDKTTKYKCDAADETLLLNMARVEHERWIASHKLMGYTYNPEVDCVQKHHDCICSWDKLKSEEIQSYDCNVVDTTIKMAYQKAQKKYKQ